MRFPGYFFLIINVIVVARIMTGREQAEHPNYPLLPQVPNCSNNVQLGRIVGGFETEIGQYPWIAQLGFTTSKCPRFKKPLYYDCGSSLITATVLLTASHCLDTVREVLCPTTNRFTRIKVGFVKLGEWNQNNEGRDCVGSLCADEIQIIPVKYAKMHEDYDDWTIIHDIAIIHLERPAKLTDWVNPICLPIAGMLMTSLVGKTGEVVGWGRTNNKFDSSDEYKSSFDSLSSALPQGILKSVEVPILEESECVKYYEMDESEAIKQTNTSICAGGTEGQDSCSGDSGGPLMVPGRVKNIEKKFLVGVVSYGPHICGSKGELAIYSSIAYHMEWILNNLV